MKYSEATKAIEALSSRYSAKLDKFASTFNVNYKNREVVCVSNYERYVVTVWFKKYFKGLPFSNKLYMILAELASTPLEERAEENKHYVKVYDSRVGYLNINEATGKMTITNVFEGNSIKTKFTDKDIEQLKQRYDIPIDWNKVTLEEVEDD